MLMRYGIEDDISKPEQVASETVWITREYRTRQSK